MKHPRNAPCHCGSGTKYKKCCLRKDEEAATPKRIPLTPAQKVEARKRLATIKGFAAAVGGLEDARDG